MSWEGNKSSVAEPLPLATEIEVTPEMIKAGAAALENFDPEYEGSDEAAIRIYRLMVRARIYTSTHIR